jgi:hypothetical protein
MRVSPLRFALAIYEDLIARLSGAMSVLLTLLAMVFRRSVPAWWFGIAAVVSFLVSSYRVWAKERARVNELTEEISVRIEVHGINECVIAEGKPFLVLPEVTLINDSHGKSVSVDGEMFIRVGGLNLYCPSIMGPLETWEENRRVYSTAHLKLPLTLGPRNVAKGYLAFNAENINHVGQQPINEAIKDCYVEFKDLHTKKVLLKKDEQFLQII